MDFKTFLKRITPPILLDLYRRPYRGCVWEGIYTHYRDVPSAGEGFDSDVWVNALRASTEVLATSKSCGTIPTGLTGERALLPLLASLVCTNSGKVKILDFGGGMGVDYIYVTSCLAECRSINYHIIESKRVCQAAVSLFGDDNRIRFHTSLPDDLSELDIVYIRSALQYVEDYRGLINKFADYKPVYFLYVDLSTGDIPTYASAQHNVRGSIIPYWFINVGEIIDLMAARGYGLIFKKVAEGECDQRNFPKPYRLKHTRNFLFARNLSNAR